MVVPNLLNVIDGFFLQPPHSPRRMVGPTPPMVFKGDVGDQFSLPGGAMVLGDRCLVQVGGDVVTLKHLPARTSGTMPGNGRRFSQMMSV